jgi:hypothetical protein
MPRRSFGTGRLAAGASRRPRAAPPTLIGALVLLLLTHSPAAGEERSTTELAKETQNPVANLISVPFQNNFNFGAGTDRDMVWIMNVQPVIPIPLNDRWNLITRTIVPIINQPSLAPGMDSAFGMGDINPSVFLSPATDKGFIWGVGLTTTLPTATDSEIGSGKWSLGPTAVGLLVKGHWVVGTLIAHFGHRDHPFRHGDHAFRDGDRASGGAELGSSVRSRWRCPLWVDLLVNDEGTRRPSERSDAPVVGSRRLLLAT